MIRWDARFQVMGPEASFPQFQNCTVESRRDLSYHCEGKRRKDETCLFDLTLEGSGVFRDAKGEHQLTPGKAFFCVLNDPDTAYYYPQGGSERWTFLWICFSGGEAAKMLRSFQARHGSICDISLKSQTAHWLLSFEKLCGRVNKLNPAESAKMTMDLLAAIEASLLSGSPSHTAEDILIEEAQKLAMSDIERASCIGTLAKELGLSREHLSRVFKRRVGISFAEWLQRRRTAMAARLLKDDGLSCKETAWRLGYGSQANFTRAFRKSTGMSPAKFKASGSWLPL